MFAPWRKTIVVAVLVITLGVWGGINLLRPPIEMTKTSIGIEIDLRSLGEYNSSLSSIQIVDLEEDEVVWRVEGRGREIQVFFVKLSLGENPYDLGLLEQDASVKVIFPSGDSHVRISKEKRYEIVATTRRWFGIEISTSRIFYM